MSQRSPNSRNMSNSRASSLKTRSQISGSSRTSIREAAAIARAKAEAAKAKSSFTEQEMQLKMEKASLDMEKAQLEVTLEKLAADKETAAAIAEAEFLEATELQETKSHRSIVHPGLESQDPQQRTSQYVYQHSKPDDNPAPQLNTKQSVDEPSQHAYPDHQKVDYQSPCTKLENTHQSETSYIEVSPEQRIRNRPLLRKMPFASERYYTDPVKPETSNRYGRAPHIHSDNTTPAGPSANQATMDIARFLAQHELVIKGLVKFTDRAENYRAWRASFQNTMRDLNLSYSQELDVLVSYLGNESADHAKRIRDINVNYPDVGLQRVWDRLDEMYGAAEVIENALFKRIEDFPKIANKVYSKLRDLSDLLMELSVAKAEGDLVGLAFLDTARGVNPIVQKLPYNLQEKWVMHGSRYKQTYNVPFPPFNVFVDFVSEQAKIRNDPSFDFMMSCATPSVSKPRRAMIEVHKTNVSSTGSVHKRFSSYQRGDKPKDPSSQCPLHRKPHSLLKCRTFRAKSLEDRKTFLKENNICFKCCSSTSHFARDCEVSAKCAECDSTDHNTALHPGPPPWASPQTQEQSGERKEENTDTLAVTSKCTEVCKDLRGGRSCSKISLVRVYPEDNRDKAIKVYAILDDQSNKSLAKSAFFDSFHIRGPGAPYSLRTCAGTVETAGRRASGYIIESSDGQVRLPLPTILECNQIPDNRSEIPTPEVAEHHPHLKRIRHLIPNLDPEAQIVLLLGRDILQVHKVRQQINGSHNAPYAQRLDLGWVIVGEVCLGGVHRPTTVNSMLTSTLENGRPSLLQPCENHLFIKELPQSTSSLGALAGPAYDDFIWDVNQDHLGSTVFRKTKEDNRMAMSFEDRLFLDIMEHGMVQDEARSWVAPLPFKPQRQRLPNNREQVFKRFVSLRHNLRNKPEMSDHFFTFMEKIFRNGHAELAHLLQESEERWYLPMFGVYHPKKPGQIRVVFDSSAKYEGVSLNNVLLSGPDLNNKLIGVLLRFRRDSIAFTADIQQMFHCFLVKKEHRNFLRFLWFKDNDPSKDVTEYRMKVHIFGNSPSPAVAIYGLRRTAQKAEEKYGADVRLFVEKDFYVDDCLKSMPSDETAISLLKRTQEMFSLSNLRLHKIASNSQKLMEAFPSQDHCEDLKDLDLGFDSPPMQRSLGLLWDIKADTFTFQVNREEKPFTRRGVLSAISSLYDPLGFAAPILIEGKAMLRDFTREGSNWDTPLPMKERTTWMA
ncbi:uncharacterized protein LOC120930263 [Rana temporaria]|uniref:uncharacterized protein LOC120930263 n=1 Tax=Rana temporaria TaxID=8407 RepID=UPI001AAD6160|nr:uncharacterized protein LOC120930263 [Rana temporaria]